MPRDAAQPRDPDGTRRRYRHGAGARPCRRAAGAGFFGFGVKPGGAAADWTALRDRWEYSHVARAAFAVLGVVLLLIAVTGR